MLKLIFALAVSFGLCFSALATNGNKGPALLPPKNQQYRNGYQRQANPVPPVPPATAPAAASTVANTVTNDGLAAPAASGTAPVTAATTEVVEGGAIATTTFMQQSDNYFPGFINFNEIYRVMVSEMGFIDGIGHTMAAGVLATCRLEETVHQRLTAYVSVLRALHNSKFGLIKCGKARENPSFAYAAATLTCRMNGDRTPVRMQELIDQSLQAMLDARTGKRIWYPNVVVAAQLIPLQTP